MTTGEFYVGLIGLLVLAVPFSILLRDLFVGAFPKGFVITNRDGEFVGEVTADTVLNKDPAELKHLRQHVRQIRNVPKQAA